MIRIQRYVENKLYENTLKFETIFQQAPIGIAISHNQEPEGLNCSNIMTSNLIFEQITGRTTEELIKLGWAQITHPEDVGEDLQNFRRLQEGEIENYSLEKRFIRPDGSIVWVYMVVAPLQLPDEPQHRHICLAQDITKRKQAEQALAESERSKSVLLSNLPGLAYRCNFDREWTMQYVSAGCTELTGYTPASFLYNRDLSFNDIIGPEYRENLWKEWEHVLSNKLTLRYEYEITTSRGERKWVLELGQGIYNEKGEVEALEGIILDISDRKGMENQLKFNSEHDTWTNLYNHRYFERVLSKDIRQGLTANRALVAINLSTVNMLHLTHGFYCSQKLIKKAANALKAYCTENLQLFHTYENRFIFYVKTYQDKQELSEFCQSVANMLESLLAIERIGGGIGVIELNMIKNSDIDQLLIDLMNISEEAVNISNRDIYISFLNEEIQERILRKEVITRELTQVAGGEGVNRLFLQYQPIVDLQTNHICGFEALARFNSEKFGRVPPLEFIPIAEKTKLILPLGHEIIVQAVHFLKRLKLCGYPEVAISINISAIQLMKSGFVQRFCKTIEEMQVNPAYITLEITESMFASDYQEINNILGELKACGIRIAIDDFGTGYSSLARERELNVNSLKIDKYFIDKLLVLEPDKTITGDIISMGHKLGHCVVAEGVEYEKQRQYLKDHGCDKIQGYLISRPLDENAAIELLEKYNEAPMGPRPTSITYF
jgi:PAS domain S-box-containing protein